MAYGIKYKCAFKSSLGAEIKVNILKRDYNSAQVDLVMGGTPVKINYTGSEDKYDTIRGSECILEFYSQYNGQHTEIMIADAQDFQVQIFKNNVMIWQGFVIQDNYSEPYSAAPYLISIRAVDGLGLLKNIDFQADDTSFYLSDMTFIEVIQKCLAKLKNATQLVTSVDVFESRIVRTNLGNESLNSLKVNSYLFIKDDLNALKCDEVLKYILEIFNCYIFYKNGKYYIERLNYKLNDILVRRTYNINFDGTVSNVISHNSENITGVISKTSGLQLANNNGNITYSSPVNKVQIDTDIVLADNILVNSYFRNWNISTNTPYNWLKVGNFSIERLTEFTTGDALRVTQKVQNDADINYNTNNLTSQKVNFTGFGTESLKLNIKFASFGNARFIVKASTIDKSYFLECTSTTELNQEVNYVGAWKEYPTFCKIERFINAARGGDWYVSEIKDMNIPPSIISLEFSLLPSYDTEIPGRPGRPDPIPYTYGYRVREFTPTISSTVATDTYGHRYLSMNDKVVKETYSNLQPVIGEFNKLAGVNQILYNNAVTANWYRDGITESRALLSIAAQSILNQYRIPFRQFSGSLYGNFDFGKVYQINSDGIKYMPFKASTDLKADMTDISMFELLNDKDQSTDKNQRVINYNGSYTVTPNPSYKPPGYGNRN